LLSAVEAYERACAADKANACEALSSLFGRDGTGVTDKEQSARFARLAKELSVRDCEHDVAKACWSLAHEELDTARQLALFERACALDDSDSCLEAGRIYDPSVYADNGEFEGIPRSEVRANPLYKKARRLFTVECAAGVANACYWLGLMSLSGWDAEVSGARAIAFFVRACDLGDLSGCSQVASIYKFGWGGVAVNPRKAGAWQGRACNRGKVEECRRAAVEPVR
jgi:TPR repeat protein